MSNVQGEIPISLNLLIRDISKNCTKAEETVIMADLKKRFDFKPKDLYETFTHLYEEGVIDENDDLTFLEHIISEKVQNKESSMLIQGYNKRTQGELLIGRQRDTDKLKEYFSDQEVYGVNLFGPSGVGKTRFAKDFEKLKFIEQDSTFLDLTAITTMSALYLFLLYTFKIITYATKNEQEQYFYNLDVQGKSSSLFITERQRIIKCLEQLTTKTMLTLDNIDQELVKSDSHEFIEFINAIMSSKVVQDGTLKVILISTFNIHELISKDIYEKHESHKPFKSIKPQRIDPLPKEISNDFITKRSKVDISEESEEELQALNQIATYCQDLPYLLQDAEHMMRKGFSTAVEVLQKIESQIGKGVLEKYACIRASFESVSSDHLKELAVKISTLRRPFSTSTAMKIAEIPSEYDAIIDLELLANQKIITKVEMKIEEMKKVKQKYEVHSLFLEFVTSSLIPDCPFYHETYKRAEQMFSQHFSCKMIALAKNLEKDFVKTFIKLEKNRVNIDLTLNQASTNSEIIEQLLPSNDHEAPCRLVVLLEALKGLKERRKLLKTWADAFEQEEKWLSSANLRCWQAIQLADMEGTENPERILQQAKTCLDKATDLASEPTSYPDQLKAGRALFRFCSGKILYMKSANIDKMESERKKKMIKEALCDLEEALAIYKELYGAHIMTVRTRNLQGNCLMELGDPDIAERAYQEALEMKLKLTGGEKHCEIATFYNQLSQVHEIRGINEEQKWFSWLPKTRRLIRKEYEEAVRYLEKALALDKELNLNDTLSSATFNRNMANILLGLRRLDKALEHANESYKLRNELLGEHPETVRILYLIGVIHEWKKDKMAALDSFEKAFIMEESLPPGNHSVMRVRICERFKLMCEKCKDKKKLQKYKKRISILQVNQITQSSTAIEDTRSRPQDEIAQEVKNSVPEICSEMIKVSVDTYGGTYNLPSHGLFLNFPPGAIDKPTEITVQSLTKNSLPSPAGDMEAVVSFIVELGPCDVVLQKPVVAEVLHSGCVGRGHYENKAMAFNKSTKIWEEIQGQYALHLPPNCLETECIQVQLSMLTTLAVISRLITNSFEVPVSGCYVVSSVCQDISLDFPKDAVDKTIEGSMKVLPMPNAIPTNIIAHPSPIVVINGFENVKFNKPATLTLPHPCPTKYPAGKVRLYIKDDEWNEMTDSICYQEHKLTIELQIIHFSSIWIFVGDDDSDINVRQLHQQLTGVPQEVCFVSFMSELESEDTSTNDIKLNICCMANHMIDSMVQRMKETFGEDFKHLAQATGKEMLPKQTVCTKVEGGNFESREEVELQFSGDTICGKELVITKKRGEEETPWFFIRFLTKNPDKTVSNNPLAQLTIDECRLDKKRSSDVPPSTADPGLENVYSMNSSPRGVLIIIENERFNSKVPPLDERTGSEKDVQALSNVFCRCLDFKMRYIRNQVIFDILRNLRKFLEETKNYDCCIVCVMSHGIDKKFYDIDGKEVKVLQIQYIVKDVFVGKPKLIFIQACRTKDTKATNCPKEDDTHNPASPVSAEEKTTEDLSLPQGFSKSNSNKVPEASQACSDEIKEAKEADILTAYSCCQGYGSWRYPEQGSLFIQTLAKTFEEKAHCMDVLSMLTEVINDVVEQCQKSEILRCDIQVCEVTTRLRKKLYLKQNNLTLSIPE